MSIYLPIDNYQGWQCAVCGKSWDAYKKHKHTDECCLKFTLDKLAAAQERIEEQRQTILAMEDEQVCLPEDVGVAEYVARLKERIEELEGLLEEYKRELSDSVDETMDLKDENQRLREALEAIEWEWAYGNGWRCPWCHALKESGWHKRDFQRQAALQKESE